MNLSEKIYPKSSKIYFDQYAGCLCGLVYQNNRSSTNTMSIRTRELFAQFGQLSLYDPVFNIPFCALYNLKESDFKRKDDKISSVKYAIYSLIRPIVSKAEKYEHLTRTKIKSLLCTITHFRSQKILRFICEFDELMQDNNHTNMVNLVDLLRTFAKQVESNEENYILTYLMLLFALHMLAVQKKNIDYLNEIFYNDHAINTERNNNITERNNNITECNNNITECNNNITECNNNIDDVISTCYGVYGLYLGYDNIWSNIDTISRKRLMKELKRIFYLN